MRKYTQIWLWKGNGLELEFFDEDGPKRNFFGIPEEIIKSCGCRWKRLGPIQYCELHEVRNDE